MVAIFNEELIPLRQAVNFIPSGRPGKRLSPNTLFRWALKGCRGVKLDTILLGSVRFTTREAIERFSVALSAGSGNGCGGGISTPSQEIVPQIKSHGASEELAASGW